MPQVIPKEGSLKLLNRLLSVEPALDGLILSPYFNDIAPGPNSVRADFATRELTGFPYADLFPGEWTSAALVDGRAQSQYTMAAQQWTNDTGSEVTVYGYVVLDQYAETVCWAERFTMPIVMANGGTLQVLPVLTMKSEY